MSARAVRVLEAGPLTTIQDRGRFGYGHLGVPRAGALDSVAAGRANLAVGNDLERAVLEILLGPFEIEVLAAMAVAVTGAQCGVRVNGRPTAAGAALSLREGDRLRIDVATTGIRIYLAFAGGIEVPAVLGSRSTDTVAWVGPARIAGGEVLPVGERQGSPRNAGPVLPPRQDVVLRYRPGPRDGWFAAGPDGAYRVSPDSDRMGLRLRGEPLRRTREGELLSEGVVLGGIQVPPDGQPVVFLNDHPTTGGYPVVGVVVPDDLPACGQLAPGATVRFQPVGPAEGR